MASYKNIQKSFFGSEIGLAILVLLGLPFLLKHVLSGSAKAVSDTVKDIIDDNTNLGTYGTKTELPYTGATPIAQLDTIKLDMVVENQYDAMNGVGTDDNINDAVENLTSDELLYVYAKFGKRNYVDFNGGDTDTILFEPEMLDLIQWYKRELSTWSLPFFDSELDEMKAIWSKTGLPF